MSTKHDVFVSAFLSSFSGTDAYLVAYPHVSRATARANASDLLARADIQDEIERRLSEVHMGANEALGILADHARADIGVFFKIVEEWTFYPLPTYDILGQKEVVDDTDEKNPKTRISYWVRHVAIDTDKLVDPAYSHLLREFSDSPKNGISIRLHDKQAAIDKILRVLGKYKDNVDITSGGEKMNPYMTAGASELLELARKLAHAGDTQDA